MKSMFSSNFIEVLARELKQNLFFSGLKSESYIFVPNKFVKNYLMQKFADDPDVEISFGLNFVNIDNFLNFFQNKLKVSKDKRFLNTLELNLLIRKKIIDHIEKDISSSLYQDLCKYLIKDGKIIERRLTKLGFELAEMFLNYSIFENEKNIILKSKKHWQIRLFLEIFYDEENENENENEKSLVFRDLKKMDIQSIKNIEFHFFLVSYMPPVYFDFINQFNNVFHYFVSPTIYFFEDFLSNFERKNLKKHLIEEKKSQKTIEELDDYLKDRNPFLANMEKLKRNYLKIVNSYDDIDFFDDYESFDQEKKTSKETKTLLSVFQEDILNLENRENNIKSIEKVDDSIQVHVASSRFREVEILYLKILNILKNDESLKPSDIHVMAENIDEYAPYIDMIFTQDKNESGNENINIKNLKYKISDLKIKNESFFITGFEKLLSLINSRFEKEDILDLFENPLFQMSHNFTPEEIKILFNWIEKANISWGLDDNHILKFLDKSDIAILKSFEKGIARIFLSAVFVLNQNFLDSSFDFDYPAFELEISDLNILDKFIKVLMSIHKDIKIIEDKKSLTLDEWQKYLKNLAKQNFQNFLNIDHKIEKEKYFIEKAAFQNFKSFLEDLKNVAFHFNHKKPDQARFDQTQSKFSFDVIFDHLEKHFSRLKIDANANSIEAINFASFEMSYLRAKAVFILGLGDTSFQIKTKSSMDVCPLKDVPSKADHQRSLFLQSLLNAEKHLILSYTSKENQKIDKAIFLEEFLSYLDSSYRISEQMPSKCIMKKHFPFSFHKGYFNEDSETFSNKNYKAALLYYKENLKTDKSIAFVKPVDIGAVDDSVKTIDLRHLRQLCKNPISFYLNKMDIYLEETREKNDFKISNLDKYIIKTAAITDDIDNILGSFEKKANMPFGCFNDIAKDKVRADVEIFLENLKELNVDLKNLINIEFDVNCKKVEKIDSKNILMPAIEIKTDQGDLKIIGKLENISNQGLLSYFDDKTYSQLRMWPDILVLNKLDKNFEKKVVFTKSKTIKTYNIDRVDDYFIELIKYYIYAQKEISFMIKPFCEHLLKSDQNLLDKAIRQTDKKNLFLDVYSTWYFKNFEKPKAKSLIEKTEVLIKIFKPILEQN